MLLAFVTLLSSAQVTGDVPPEVPSTIPSPIYVTAMFPNGTAIASTPIFITVRTSDTHSDYHLVTGPKGEVLLVSEGKKAFADALLDNPSTSGPDYAASTELLSYSFQNATLVFYPSGGVVGRAEDSFGSPLFGANISVSCPTHSFDYGSISGGETTGRGGEFSLRALPIGKCMISASKGELAGSSEIAVKQGEITSAKIVLASPAPPVPDAPIVKDDYGNWLLIGAAFILGAIAVAFFILQKKPHAIPTNPVARQTPQAEAEKAEKPAKRNSSPKKQKAPHASQEPLSPQAQAVLNTLSEREREIVLFLFSSGGRAKRSQMQHKLLIPKTSLLRNLRALERKNIVKLTPFGRNLLAELGDWHE